MKYLIYIFCISCLAISPVRAQLLPPLQPEQDACNALVLCGVNFTFPYSYQGIGNISDLTNTPCSGGEGNVMWMRLNINTGGIIVFTINPIDPADDYDFAVLDITNSSCSTLSTTNVIRCNFNNNNPIFNNGILGLNTTSTTLFTPAGATGGSYLQQISANPGDVYLIMVNNFGVGFGGNSPTSGFTIDFTGTTATFNGSSPVMQSLSPVCNAAKQVVLQVSENIRCNSIDPGGSDFAVTPSGTVLSAVGLNCSGSSGYTDKILLTFDPPLPPGSFSLDAKNGSDGNTLLNLCNNPLLTPASLPFTVDPYTLPTYNALATPACSEVRIRMAAPVRCDAIAKNGSDFTITGPQPVGVIGAYGTGCDTMGVADSVVLVLQSPIQTDGLYTVHSKVGTDGNTLLDSCGLPQPVGDLITWTINSYDGQLVAPADSVICAPGYLTLDAVNNSAPPPVAVSCDTTNITCTGSTRGAFIGGKDSLSNANTPFFGASDDNRVQYLFLASELREMGLKPGSIRALEWKVTQKVSTNPFSNFTIKLGCTPFTSLGNTFVVSTKTVYNGQYTTVPGWNRFDLMTAYNWDGISNLIVETCFDNITSSQSDEVVHSATPFVSVLRRSTFGFSGCAISTQGTLGQARMLRPKARFHICEPPAGEAPYVWSPGNLLSDSTVRQPLAYVDGNRSYQVRVTDKYGCAHRDSTKLTLSVRNPDLFPRDTTICLGDKVRLEASGGINYSWLTGVPGTLSCLDCAAPLASPEDHSVYYVRIADAYDCADTLESRINVHTLPVVTILPRDTTVKFGQTIQLAAGGGLYYTWYPAGYVSDPNIVMPTATIREPIMLILYGIDANGCRNADSIRIGVDYTDPVFIPSAFSPNGDGQNDLFRVGSLSFQRLSEFRIFNRWGQEIFSTTDPRQGWDGTYRGANQDPGVYHYLIRLAYPDGKVETYKGDLTLVR